MIFIEITRGPFPGGTLKYESDVQVPTGERK